MQEERNAIIQKADLVISLLPAFFAYPDCAGLSYSITKFYLRHPMWMMKSASWTHHLKEKKLLFLCEMGLDPGIDHMSAMQIITASMIREEKYRYSAPIPADWWRRKATTTPGIIKSAGILPMWSKPVRPVPFSRRMVSLEK